MTNVTQDDSTGAAGRGFAATYSDWKVVRGRKVCQVVLEIPIEQANEALAILGGMPNPANETWVGVARLHVRAVEKKKRQWEDMTPTQQAGTLCSDPMFHRWLGVENAEQAAYAVRDLCGVTSRKHIVAENEGWQDLNDAFRRWKQGQPF